MEDMADACAEIASSAKYLQKLAEEYASTSGDEVFYSESILKETFDELNLKIKNFEQFKEVMDKVLNLSVKTEDSN